ncbi:MAG: hypothetical protein A2Y92_02520 [Chloroflexi bacterium RBG_13_57_8]|nr:MAG: hypothetical protein A2Y92_02520 [Chloroflexi bacterium RBG_13_57_8]
MGKPRIINIVATECTPEYDAQFNKWYNEVHIPMLMKYKGIKKVTRYRIIEENREKPRFLAVYEYDKKEDLDNMTASPEFKAAIEEMRETEKTCKFEIKGGTLCEPIETWER